MHVQNEVSRCEKVKSFIVISIIQKYLFHNTLTQLAFSTSYNVVDRRVVGNLSQLGSSPGVKLNSRIHSEWKASF